MHRYSQTQSGWLSDTIRLAVGYSWRVTNTILLLVIRLKLGRDMKLLGTPDETSLNTVNCEDYEDVVDWNSGPDLVAVGEAATYDVLASIWNRAPMENRAAPSHRRRQHHRTSE